MQQHKFENLEFLARPGRSQRAIVMLHGYGANQHDLVPLADALDPDSQDTWYFPNGILRVPLTPFYDSRAWMAIDLNAYQTAISQGRFRDYMAQESGRITDVSAIVSNWIKTLFSQHDSLILGGFSQGAIVSLDVALALNSPQIQKIVFLSGTLACQERWSQDLQTAKPGFAVFQSHGQSDPILPFSEAKLLHDLLRESGITAEFHAFAGGHEIPGTVLRALSRFLTGRAAP